MANGISAILMQLAEAATRHAEDEKRAFIPMPGGQAAPVPADPSMAGGMPAGMPMDPSMAGAGMPADPSMVGAGAPGMDPMAMAAQGADPAAILAAQGVPVNPGMAAAAGAQVPAPAAAPAAPAEEAKPSKRDKIDEIYSMLTKIMGVLVGKGLLAPADLGGVLGADSGSQAGGQVGGVPPEQKVAEELPSMGSSVEDAGPALSAKQAGSVKNALAGLILALNGGTK